MSGHRWLLWRHLVACLILWPGHAVKQLHATQTRLGLGVEANSSVDKSLVHEHLSPNHSQSKEVGYGWKRAGAFRLRVGDGQTQEHKQANRLSLREDTATRSYGCRMLQAGGCGVAQCQSPGEPPPARAPITRGDASKNDKHLKKLTTVAIKNN